MCVCVCVPLQQPCHPTPGSNRPPRQWCAAWAHGAPSNGAPIIILRYVCMYVVCIVLYCIMGH